ncbi:MAG: hypothetical protein KIH69_022620 [Anaerolineae bacterium]|nr:hypothetical protein [Anaerolineae bacterium]
MRYIIATLLSAAWLFALNPFAPLASSLQASATLTPIAFLPLVAVLSDGTPTPAVSHTPTPTESVIATATSQPSTPTPESTAEATDTPTPRPAFSCAIKVDASQAPNIPVRIVDVYKQRFPEMVTLQNMSNSVVDLTDWHMCSLNGGQQHRGLTGQLQPGETRDFVNVGNPIWDDDAQDDGALFDPAGQLISYWKDTP